MLLCREVAVCLCRILSVRSASQRGACTGLAVVTGASAFVATAMDWNLGQSLAAAVAAAWFVVLASALKGTRQRP